MKNLLFVCFLFLSVACNSQQTESTVAKRMDLVEWKASLSQLESPQLIDIRTPEEYADGTIESAINVNFMADNFVQSMDQFDKESPIFIFCRSGGRSGKALNVLTESGFTDIRELKSGYLGWEK